MNIAQLGFRVGFRDMKKGFFDRRQVVDAMDNATKTVFSKFGMYVMRDARKSMHQAKSFADYSKPGHAPLVHMGLIKDFLLYCFDPAERAVIIGPAWAGKNPPGYGATTVPEVLEKGGFVHQRLSWWKLRRMHEAGKTDYGFRVAFLALKDKAGEMRNVFYAPRPYMQPAFDAKIKNELPKLWKNALK